VLLLLAPLQVHRLLDPEDSEVTFERWAKTSKDGKRKTFDFSLFWEWQKKQDPPLGSSERHGDHADGEDEEGSQPPSVFANCLRLCEDKSPPGPNGVPTLHTKGFLLHARPVLSSVLRDVFGDRPDSLFVNPFGAFFKLLPSGEVCMNDIQNVPMIASMEVLQSLSSITCQDVVQMLSNCRPGSLHVVIADFPFVRSSWSANASRMNTTGECTKFDVKPGKKDFQLFAAAADHACGENAAVGHSCSENS
jgi:hypothetical protein